MMVTPRKGTEARLEAGVSAEALDEAGRRRALPHTWKSAL